MLEDNDSLPLGVRSCAAFSSSLYPSFWLVLFSAPVEDLQHRKPPLNRVQPSPRLPVLLGNRPHRLILRTCLCRQSHRQRRVRRLRQIPPQRLARHRNRMRLSHQRHPNPINRMRLNRRVGAILLHHRRGREVAHRQGQGVGHHRRQGVNCAHGSASGF